VGWLVWCRKTRLWDCPGARACFVIAIFVWPFGYEAISRSELTAARPGTRPLGLVGNVIWFLPGRAGGWRSAWSPRALPLVTITAFLRTHSTSSWPDCPGADRRQGGPSARGRREGSKAASASNRQSLIGQPQKSEPARGSPQGFDRGHPQQQGRPSPAGLAAAAVPLACQRPLWSTRPTAGAERDRASPAKNQKRALNCNVTRPRSSPNSAAANRLPARSRWPQSPAAGQKPRKRVLRHRGAGSSTQRAQSPSASSSDWAAGWRWPPSGSPPIAQRPPPPLAL